MKKQKKYWLNEHGERYWYFKYDISITACRSYYWVDRVTYIHESEVHQYNGRLTTSGRHWLTIKEFNHPQKYSEFKNEKHLWVPIKDFNEYTKKLKFYYDCKKYNL